MSVPVLFVPAVQMTPSVLVGYSERSTITGSVA
jgi:hypothetical protein